jgi:TPR repeat protein
MLTIDSTHRIKIDEVEQTLKTLSAIQASKNESDFSSEGIYELTPQKIYELAVRYEQGDGIEKNLSKAFLLFQKPAELEHIDSMIKYG